MKLAVLTVALLLCAVLATTVTAAPSDERVQAQSCTCYPSGQCYGDCPTGTWHESVQAQSCTCYPSGQCYGDCPTGTWHESELARAMRQYELARRQALPPKEGEAGGLLSDLGHTLAGVWELVEF